MYGEAVPPDSGTTVAQKTHGFTTLEGVTASPRDQRERYAHVSQLGCRAVLLVRDPAAAIVSHRHLDAAGHLGFAPPSHFQGEGMRVVEGRGKGEEGRKGRGGEGGSDAERMLPVFLLLSSPKEGRGRGGSVVGEERGKERVVGTEEILV